MELIYVGNKDTFHTTNEVALLLKRHPQTLRSALKDGSLHGEQASGDRGHWRILIPCAEAWNRGEKCEHYQARGLHLSRHAS